jgi:riboflavin kinase/FMN adenylyltransferase
MLLGRPYSLTGKVVHGNARGKSLGYPTANIELPVRSKLTPQNGIYFVKVSWGGGSFYGMTSIGVRPTFEPLGSRTIEAYILDFRGDLYGKELEVQFLRRLRDEKKFDSVQELINQMDRDKAQSLALAEEYSKILTGLQQKRVNR